VCRLAHNLDWPVKNYMDRLTYENGRNLELIFLRMWQARNTAIPGVDHGIRILEHILGGPPTFAESRAVASFICWLGTSVGGCFLAELGAVKTAFPAELTALRRKEFDDAEHRRKTEKAEKSTDLRETMDVLKLNDILDQMQTVEGDLATKDLEWAKRRLEQINRESARLKSLLRDLPDQVL
jgi:hypothetical protein